MSPLTVVCVDNSEYPCSLELGKAYIVVPDETLEPEDIRVIDESGEDYIYPASYFSSSHLETIEVRRAQQVKGGEGVTVWIAGYVSRAPLPNRAPFPSLVSLGYKPGEVWGHEVVADSPRVALEKMQRTLTCWDI